MFVSQDFIGFHSIIPVQPTTPFMFAMGCGVKMGAVMPDFKRGPDHLLSFFIGLWAADHWVLSGRMAANSSRD